MSYNRYAYCNYNPLKYVDPTGYSAYKDYMDHTYGEGNYWYRGNGPGTWGGDCGGSIGGGGGGGSSSYYYDWHAGKYRNSWGGAVSYDEFFMNAIVPNSITYAGPDPLGVAQNLLEGYSLYRCNYGGQTQYALLKKNRNYSFRQLLRDGVTGLEGGATSIDYWILPNATGQGGGDGLVNLAEGALGFMSADALVLDPSDAVWFKWAGYAVAATAATIVINHYAGKGNASYPGPWSYTVPDPTSPFYNPPKPPNFNPGDYENIVKWAAGLTLGARFLQKMYEGTNQSPYYTCPQDATRIYRGPVIPIQPDVP